MKVLFVKKKFIFSTFLLLFFIILACLYFLKPFSFAIELSRNSVIDENLKEKISSLTKEEQKIAYLTFDDGPTKKATPKILDILEQEEIKATFFVIGKHVKEYPEIVKREYEEGHYIANHGYNHNNKKLYESQDSFRSEIQNTDIEIGKAIGVENYCSHVFRFPNGYMSPNNKQKKKEAIKLLSELQYTYIDWNCLNNDSVKKYSNSQLLNNLKKSAKDKGTLVILMHDTSDVNNTPNVLESSINYLKEQGYEFKTFYDIIK